MLVFFNNIHKKHISLIALELSADTQYEYKTLVLLKTQTSPAATAYLHKPLFFFCFVKQFHFKPIFVWLLILQCDCIKPLLVHMSAEEKQNFNRVIRSSLASP